MESQSSRQVMMVAAEASSALYAEKLLKIWKAEKRNVHAFGIGSRQMAELGFEVRARSEDMSIIGLFEVLSHYRRIKAVFNDLVEQVKVRKPDFVLLMDYSGFNLRLAKKLKPLGVPVIYFISPQVWAWRQGRVKTIRENVDKMLVILPFEHEFYNTNNVASEFVGHPLLDELDPRLFDQKERQFLRKKFGVHEQDFLVGVMPGSRRSELEHNLGVQLQAVQRLHERNPQVKIAILVAPNFDLSEFKKQLPPMDFPFIIMRDEPAQMVSLCDAILCASGTATLVVGLLEKPMVIMYKVGAITAFIGRRLVKVDHFGLINLILGERAVPELFQEEATAEKMADELEKYVRDPELYEITRRKLSQARFKLGERGALNRVAAALAPYFKGGTRA